MIFQHRNPEAKYDKVSIDDRAHRVTWPCRTITAHFSDKVGGSDAAPSEFAD
jgi:hypothetical protein